jgi:hypothetical protein
MVRPIARYFDDKTAVANNSRHGKVGKRSEDPARGTLLQTPTSFSCRDLRVRCTTHSGLTRCSRQWPDLIARADPHMSELGDNNLAFLVSSIEVTMSAAWK